MPKKAFELPTSVPMLIETHQRISYLAGQKNLAGLKDLGIESLRRAERLRGQIAKALQGFSDAGCLKATIYCIKIGVVTDPDESQSGFVEPEQPKPTLAGGAGLSLIAA